MSTSGDEKLEGELVLTSLGTTSDTNNLGLGLCARNKNGEKSVKPRYRSEAILNNIPDF